MNAPQKPANNQRRIAVAGGSVVAASAALMAFLGTWEGREYTVYADKLAAGLPTVCKGITKHITDTPIIVGQRWSAEKCSAEEAAAIAKVQGQLAKCFTVPPPQDVFDAFSSHAWNVGAPSTCKSSAMQAANAGDWMLACQRLSRSDTGRPVWVFAGGKFVQGLDNRRRAETAYCQGVKRG